jgi:hypothetical protein
MLKRNDRQSNIDKNNLEVTMVKSIGLPTLIIAAFFLSLIHI